MSEPSVVVAVRIDYENADVCGETVDEVLRKLVAEIEFWKAVRPAVVARFESWGPTRAISVHQTEHIT